MWIEEWSSLIVLRMPYPKITETGFYLPCCYCQEAELTQTLRKLFVAFFFINSNELRIPGCITTGRLTDSSTRRRSNLRNISTLIENFLQKIQGEWT